MSGKSARRLRRLAEQATNSQHGATTIRPYEENRAYKEVPVLANRSRGNPYSSNTAKVIKVDQNNPRAFYQQAKRMYKDGQGAAEAKRIEKQYREEQKRAAKQFAENIEAIVEGKGEYSHLAEKGAMPHPEPKVKISFKDWLEETQHPLAELLPFDITATPEEMENGIITATIKRASAEQGVTFKVNKDGEFAVQQEHANEWRMFMPEKFGNDTDELYTAVAEELLVLLQLKSEPIESE